MVTAPPAGSPTAARAAVLEELRAQVRRARELSTSGRPARATTLVRAARRRAERLGTDVEVRILVARSYLTESTSVLDMTGRLADALALLDRAEATAREVAAPALLATVAAQRALLVLRSGDTGGALGAFDVAVGHLDALEPRDRAIVMLNRGVLRLEHHHLDGARTDLTRSVDHAVEAADPTLESMARHNLGCVDFLAGRIPRAIAAYRQAAATWPDDPHPAMQLDLARGLREAGLLAEADEVLAQVAAHARQARLFQDLGETELVLAECALAQDQPRRALTHARSARRRFARRGNVRWLRRAELAVLQCERAALEDGVVGAPGGAGSGVAGALVRLGRRAERLADVCAAEQRHDLARAASLLAAECRLRSGHRAGPAPAVRTADPLPVRLAVREVRALAAAADAQPARALREVRKGLDELGAFQRRLGSLDLRTAGAVHGVRLARIGLEVTLAQGRPGPVLSVVERSRAISTRLSRLSPPDDDATAGLLTELRRVEDEATSLAGEPAAAARLARLHSRAAALQREVLARSWEVEGESGSRVPLAPAVGDIRTAAREQGTAFLSLARHRERWLGVLVRGHRTELVHLAGTAEVAELVRRVRADLDVLASPHLPGPMAHAVRSSLRVGLERLDTLLLGPLRLEGAPVVISCSGPLALLPWGLLPSRVGVPTVTTPSAGTWLHGRTRPRPAAPRTRALAGPGLHASEQEARAVAATWPGSALLCGAAATTAAAHDALAGADVLHVAAHGAHREQSPLFSSLRLADGPLFAYEIDPARGTPACVTLSACEAGLATLRPGDEGLGLTHVLLHVGVAAVVAGVARVRDDVAAAVMQRVHTLMAAGTDTAEALATASAEARDAPVPAPFVAFGSGW